MQKQNIQKNKSKFDKKWDRIHDIASLKLQYPNEHVVRYLFKNFPREVNKRKKLKILDLGCGNGRHIKVFAEQGFTVYGVDYSKQAIEHTKRLLKIYSLEAEVIRADVNKLPYPDSFFDGIVSIAVLYYNDKLTIKQSINELYRVLKPGSSAVIYLKTTNDYYFNVGKKIDKKTLIMTDKDKYKKGMVLHFLSKNDVFKYFSQFKKISLEKEEFTSGNLAKLNSHWIITLVK